MPRIPETELSRIKQDVSLLERVWAEGIEVKRHGAAGSGGARFMTIPLPASSSPPRKICGIVWGRARRAVM